jgi:DHA2 family multidrug resistance protein
LIIGGGFALTAFALWRMSHFDLQMDAAAVTWSGFMQGVGTGIAFVALASVTFTTLAPALRNEGTAIFSLTRNIGSSIGISVMETLLTRNTQIQHAVLGEHVGRYSALLRAQASGALQNLRGVAGFNALVTKQATMIAYNDDFKLMMVLSLTAIPLLLFMRKTDAQPRITHVQID